MVQIKYSLLFTGSGSWDQPWIWSSSSFATLAGGSVTVDSSSRGAQFLEKTSVCSP